MGWGGEGGGGMRGPVRGAPVCVGRLVAFVGDGGAECSALRVVGVRPKEGHGRQQVEDELEVLIRAVRARAPQRRDDLSEAGLLAGLHVGGVDVGAWGSGGVAVPARGCRRAAAAAALRIAWGSYAVGVVLPSLKVGVGTGEGVLGRFDC